jgi:membrane-associated HD superfamily phosphohydrolase
MKKPLIISVFILSLAGFMWATGFLEFRTKQLANRAAEKLINRQVETSSATSEEKRAITENISWSLERLSIQRAEEERISSRRLFISFAFLILITCLCTSLLKQKKNA